mgnify:FL=1
MKFFLGLFISFFLIVVSANSINYEEVGNHYGCDYIHGEETFYFKLIQTDKDKYLMGGADMDFSTIEKVLKDTDTTLIIGNGGLILDKGKAARIIFIDKKLLIFSMTVLTEPKLRSQWKNGIWADKTGKCNVLINSTGGPMIPGLSY